MWNLRWVLREEQKQLSNDKARRQMNKEVDRNVDNVYGDELDLLGQNERVCVGQQQKI